MASSLITTLEILLIAIAGYVTLLLLLELVLWKAQPNMENVVTLFVVDGDVSFARKLYGFKHHGKLYVSSNHWFRQWYHAIVRSPDLEVEHAGEVKAYKAVAITGHEREEVAREYKMGFVFKLMCGFAPRRFLRLDPRGSNNDSFFSNTNQQIL